MTPDEPEIKPPDKTAYDDIMQDLDQIRTDLTTLKQAFDKLCALLDELGYISYKKGT